MEPMRRLVRAGKSHFLAFVSFLRIVLICALETDLERQKEREKE